MSLQQYELTIATGIVGVFPVFGDTLQVFEASGVFSYGPSPSMLVEGRIGDTHSGAFSGFYVRNDDVAPITVKVRYGVGLTFQPMSDNSTVSFNGAQPVTLQSHPPGFDTLSAPGDEVVATANAGLISAASASKKETVIMAASTNAGPVRIGPAGVGAASGLPLKAGGLMVISGQQAIYARNDTGSNATLHILETGTT